MERRSFIWAVHCWTAQATYPGGSGGPPFSLPYLVLLRVGFTELPRSPEVLVSSYLTLSPLPPVGGGFLSVALSFGSPRVAVNDHPALWSSDFPPLLGIGGATTLPTSPPFLSRINGPVGQTVSPFIVLPPDGNYIVTVKFGQEGDGFPVQSP
jgi:hypothetical protein